MADPAIAEEIPDGFAFAGKPVSLITGAENLLRTDLSIGRVCPITIKRRYQSDSGYDSPLGYGWAHSYDKRLFTYPDGSVVMRKDAGWKRRFLSAGGEYITPRGESGTLYRNTDDSFIYLLKDGTREYYDVQGRLARIVTATGSSLVLSYQVPQREPLEGLLPANIDQSSPLIVAYDYRLSRIEEVDAAGNLTGIYVDFQYDPSTGRLVGLADSSSRSVSYDHDAIGNLTSATGPGFAATYGYEEAVRKHLLTRINEGEGEYVNTYDDKGRVSRQTHGSNYNYITFSYISPARKTQTTRYLGYNKGAEVRTVEFDELARVVKVTDHFGNETRFIRNPGDDAFLREEHWENTPQGSNPSNLVSRAVSYFY